MSEDDWHALLGGVLIGGVLVAVGVVGLVLMGKP